jgi:flagellar protein FliS
MNSYFDQMILSASPIELIRLLYRQAISSVRDAREHLRAGRIAERTAAINKAYAVLLTLAQSLRPEDAPELAARLAALYDYMQRKLIEANFRKAEAPLGEVLGLLSTLAEAWNEMPESHPVPVQTNSPWHTGRSEALDYERVAVTA